MQVGSEEDHLGRRDGQLAFHRTRGRTDDTDDVSPAEDLMRGREGVRVFGIPGGIHSQQINRNVSYRKSSRLTAWWP